MSPEPTTALSATLAIFLVPAIAILASFVLLRASDLVSTQKEAGGYAALIGGLSLGSVLPAGYIVQNVLPSRALLLYRGETDPNVEGAIPLSEFSSDAQHAIELALRAGESYVPTGLDIPREFVAVDGPVGHEFVIITDVILFGHPLNEVYAMVAILALFAAAWGAIVVTYLTLTRPESTAHPAD